MTGKRSAANGILLQHTKKKVKVSPMATKKPKVVQLKGSEAEELIVDYLESQYRPFAINDIVQNLHNKVSKPVAQKALESLAEQERVISKTFGKVVIYVCKEQELSIRESADTNEYTIEALTQLRSQLSELEKDRNAALEEWNKVRREPSNDELIRIIEQHEAELICLREGIEELERSWDPSNENAIKQMMSTEDLLAREMKKRSRWLKCLVSLIKDTVRPSNMAEFLDGIGCEYYELI